MHVEGRSLVVILTDWEMELGGFFVYGCDRTKKERSNIYCEIPR